MTANADAGLPYRREAAARRPSLDIGDGLMIETKNPLLSLIPSQNAYAAVPTPEELKARLASRISEVGQPALAEFAYIQRRAAEVWGPAPTAHFARVLRDARVSAKAPRASKWKKAKAAVPRLPSAWRDVFQKKIEVSEAGKTVAGEPPWSADYLLSVINALAAWSGFCEAHGLPLAPTGANLERYARGCVNRNHNPVSERTAADYLQRVHSGYILIDPEYPSRGCEFVIRDWRERARSLGTPTKTGAQLVSARLIYDLGFSLIDDAHMRSMRGLYAAKGFRNGLMLAIGAALPERARALSYLAFERTLFLLEGGHIHVQLPASALKMLERLKLRSDGRDTVFRNQRLHTALLEYRTMYRPLFDDGDCLFPSMKSAGTAIAEGHIGKLTGNLTQMAFGTRIPIHRLRDNVATEAAENLEGGIYAAASLLRHRDIATTSRYDHSEGVRAAEEFGTYVSRKGSKGIDLDL